MRWIVFVAPNVYVLRNWLASGLARLCADELQLMPVFLSPFADELLPCPSGRRFRNHRIVLEPPARAGLEWWLHERAQLLRTHLFAQEIDYAGVQMLTIARRRDRYHLAARLLRTALPRRSGLRRRLRRLLAARAPRAAAVAATLQELRPVCVVTGSPGFNPIDSIVMGEAARQGVPRHCVVSSWDNLTTRGPMRGAPETLMVWNDAMRAAAAEIHDYPAQRVHVVGALQFVPYAAEVSRAESERLYQQLQRPFGTPYLLYVTGQQFPDHEAEDVAMLVRVLKASRHAALPLVVRVHPQAPLEPFQALAGGPVAVDQAPRFADSGLGGGRFGVADVRHMAALLQHATLVIGNGGATTALLEAAIFDRPIVHLRWVDQLPRRRPEQQALVRDSFKLRHLALFDAAGCRHFCDRPDTLEATMDEALARHGAFHARRQAAVQSLVRLPLSAAPHRVVEVLRTTLEPLGAVASVASRFRRAS